MNGYQNESPTTEHPRFYVTDAEELDEAAIDALVAHFKLSAYNAHKVRMVIADQRISDRY